MGKIYPESPPIGYFLDFDCLNAWREFIATPESKRYPDTKPEWDVLIDRQNRVIDSLIPQQATIRIVINYIAIDCYLFKSFDLENIGVFVDEEGETVDRSFTFQTTWEHATLKPLLVLIAHYDSGMDVILKDAHTLAGTLSERSRIGYLRGLTGFDVYSKVFMKYKKLLHPLVPNWEGDRGQQKVRSLLV
jgi:hypothetical protein